MASTATCLWCSDTLLRHVRRSGIYWLCPSCRQEIHPSLINVGRMHMTQPLQESPGDLSPREFAPGEMPLPLALAPLPEEDNTHLQTV